MRCLRITVLAVVLLVAGCDLSKPDRSRGGDQSRSDEPHAISAAEVEALAKVRFPAGTVLLSTTYQSALDWHLTAMFRLPRTALPAFVSDSGFPALTPDLRTVTNGDHPPSDTWKPDAATQVAGAKQTESPANGVFREVMFDVGQPVDVTGYLVAFTT